MAIIGAGPIGIELHVALRAAGIPVLHLDAGSIGATMAWWAPGTRFFSSPERIAIAGVPLISPDQEKATRESYLDYLRGVVQQFGLPLRTGTRVERIERDGDGFALHTCRSTHGVGGPEESTRPADVTAPSAVHRASRVVLAIGNMHRPRRLGIPGEDRLHVSHFAGDPHRHHGRQVVIVGGKNSAAETALRLYRVGARVTISYRGHAFDPKRVKYWLRPELEWLISKGRLRWRGGTVPVEIIDDAVLLRGEDGAVEHVPVDDVLILTGYVQDRTLFEQLGIEGRGETMAPVVDPETLESAVPGVHVIGTALGGSQARARLFIENSHVHVERVTRALTGAPPPFPCEDVYGAFEES